MKQRIVIANASGYWGDEADAVRRQVVGGPIDYLTMDYLAEITMIILARQKAQSEELGYARDFVAHLGSVLEEVAARGITVIANAGGMNPGACARAVERLLADRGLRLAVAVVDGDDLMPRLSELSAAGCAFPHLETGEPMGKERLARVNSANAYIGARPIVAALAEGARIVITGRAYDAASVVAPMVHEFGWDWQDWDRLAAALLAGHLIECGAQVTGGNYTLWREVGSYRSMGYPLIEAHPDGSFVLTKHPKSGGLVSTDTVTEQVLYEIGDPRAYVSPDVVADFTSFTLEQAGDDRVLIRGVQGRPPPQTLKVSMTYDAGFRVVAMAVVSGPEAVAKAQRFAEIFWERLDESDFIEHRTELVGYSACWGSSAAPKSEPNELVLRFAARSRDREPLLAMVRAVAGIALAGPAGICGVGGRPQVSPAFGYWPALIERGKVTARMFVNGRGHEFPCDDGPCGAASLDGEEERPLAGLPVSDPCLRVPVGRIAHGRSGDKGDTCNIGLAALRPELVPVLLREVTAERVAARFRSTLRGTVSRYRLDNLGAVNFVLRRALGGGGTTSLLLDSQGKTLAEGLLAMEIDVERELLGG